MTNGCDCHVHVFGAVDRFPQIARRAYTAGPAPLEALRRAAAPLGISRFVVVQPSVYGADNRCTLEALEALGGEGRAVLVLDPSTAAQRLDEYAALGVCGIRLNLYSVPAAGGHDGNDGDAAAERIGHDVAAWGEALAPGVWHLEVIAPLPILAKAAASIAASPLRIVVDHYGLPGDETPEGDLGRRLLELAALPHVWIKLSAPYRTAADPLATRPRADWIAALVAAAPDRVVWGSDWPHTPPHEMAAAAASPDSYRGISYARLATDFVQALPDRRAFDAIFISNPGRLFGFA